MERCGVDWSVRVTPSLACSYARLDSVWQAMNRSLFDGQKCVRSIISLAVWLQKCHVKSKYNCKIKSIILIITFQSCWWLILLLLTMNSCWNGVNILVNHKGGATSSYVPQFEPLIWGVKVLHRFLTTFS